MTPTSNCHPLHRPRLLTLLVVAAVSGACAETPQEAPARLDSTRIVSLETVQRSMAAHGKPTPLPIEEPEATPATATAPTRTVTGGTAPTTKAAAPVKPTTSATRARTAAHAPAATIPQPSAPTVARAEVNAGTATAQPVATVAESAASAAGAAAQPLAAAVMTTAMTTATAAAPGDESSPIYSKDNPDVTPARLLTSQSRAGLGTASSDINTMELIVSKHGRVEQVKLAAPPKRMTDMLLLSGAKTWRFAPATKDGQPVRYRTEFSWETTR